MILTLRKRHRQIWLILAIILPLLFVAAVLVIPRPVYQEKLYQNTEKETPTPTASPKQEKDQNQ